MHSARRLDGSWSFPSCRATAARTSAPLFLGLVLPLLFACGESSPSPATVVVRDSAGIAIVENSGRVPLDGGGWSLSPEPRVEIGSFGGPEEDQLFRVRGAARLPDGRIAVANQGSRDLRIFGPDGSYLAAMGGEGEGPGEFQSVELAGVYAGDTLIVVDRRLMRISLLHPDAGFVRSVGMAASEVYLLRCAGMFDDGSVMMEGMTFGEDETDGYARRTVWYQSQALDGTIRTDFGEYPGSETVAVTRQTDHGIATVLEEIPFGKTGRAVAEGGRFYYGSQDRFQVQGFDPAGGLERIVRWARDPVAVTEADLAAFTADAVAAAEDENEARELRGRLESAPLPDFHPAYGGLHADANGYLFVEEYRRPGEGALALTIFDPRGALVGRLEIPVELEVLEIGPDHLLGLYRDDLEVEYVRSYDLTRPAN